ncbi:MAG: glutathione S-transferase family protein [Bdellovibrionota bacterium]
MNKLKLYSSLRSPFGRRIRVRLEELELPYDIEMVNVFEPTEELLRLNPLGRIPILVLPTEEEIIDSHQIEEYLRARNRSHSLYSNPEGIRDARARSWSALAVGVMEATVSSFLETLRPAALQIPEVKAEFLQAIQKTLKRFESEITSPLLAGSELRAWDIDLGCALAYCDLRMGRQVVDRYPRLRIYLERLESRASFQKTAPPL